MSPKRRIDPQEGRRALDQWCATEGCGAAAVDRPTMALAVRFTLEEFAHRHPGGSVEVRVPPFGVVQAVEGPKHTRGTPPSTVEADAVTWLSLVTGRVDFDTATRTHAVAASGVRADLSDLLPLFDPRGRTLA